MTPSKRCRLFGLIVDGNADHSGPPITFSPDRAQRHVKGPATTPALARQLQHKPRTPSRGRRAAGGSADHVRDRLRPHAEPGGSGIAWNTTVIVVGGR
jgi:hypothetical protein